MIVYIDDSGDAGFKFHRGSSTHFVLALVCFETDADAERTAARIDRLRGTLGFSSQMEFKFNKSTRAVREQFLRRLAGAPFTIRSLVIDKPALADPRLMGGKRAFYETAVREVVQRNQEVLAAARVRIDGKADKIQRQRMQTDLRRIAQVGEVRLLRSHADVLIQMADMVAGATRIAYAAVRTDAAVYRALIARHIVDEWRFPA